jgi:predicted secreted protein
MTEVVLDRTASGSVATVVVGDTILVRLGEDAATGFRWTVDERGMLALEAEEYRAESATIGGGGERTLRFRTPVAGRTALRLSLRREGEPNTIADTFAVVLDLQSP